MFHLQEVAISTSKTFEIHNLTTQVQSFLNQIKAKDGLVNVFTRHTTAIVKINEAEEGFWKDLQIWADAQIPLETEYHHDDLEHRDPSTMVSIKDENLNGYAHLRAMVLGASSETIPVQAGQMLLGRRQKILFIEMDRARTRTVVFSFVGANE